MMTRRHPWIAAIGVLWAAFFSLNGLASETRMTEVPADEHQPVWIDVRTAEERTEGYLVGVAHIPHDQIGDRIGEVAPDRDQPIHLFCRSGNRSGIAINTLRAMGYTNLHNEGSFEDAVAARPDLTVKCPACPADH